jgi:hypothetical protein
LFSTRLCELLGILLKVGPRFGLKALGKCSYTYVNFVVFEHLGVGYAVGTLSADLKYFASNIAVDFYLRNDVFTLEILTIV